MSDSDDFFAGFVDEHGKPCTAIKIGPTPSTYRARLEFLLFDLWCEGLLSEQQCAQYAGTDLVGMRVTLDCQALLRGFKCREDAQT